MKIEDNSENLTDPYGSSFLAFLRLLGFFSLIIFLLPVQLLLRKIRPELPFYIAQIFYRQVCRLLGIQVNVHGTMATTPPVMFVVNHTSYLDIIILGSLIPAAFVAKSEVAGWPMIGGLAKLQNTIFIERRSTRIAGQKSHLQNHLADRKSLILFPEGTSSSGQTVLPFKTALFSIVEEPLGDIEIAVQPVSLTCTGLNNMPMTRSWRSFYAWYGDMTLVPHLWNVFGLGQFKIDVIFHRPVRPGDFPDRKTLAQYCQQQVAKGVEQSLTGRPLLSSHAGPSLNISASGRENNGACVKTEAPHDQ